MLCRSTKIESILLQRRIRLQISENYNVTNQTEALAKFPEITESDLSEILEPLFHRKIAEAEERCLPSREAHPKAHDIPARNTGSQELPVGAS